MSRITRQDQEFLDRLDWAWLAIFTIAGFLIAPAVQEAFFGSHGAGAIITFVILSVSIILPFVVEIWAHVSRSAGKRFLSWTILVIAIVTNLIFCAFKAIWFPLFASTSPTLGGFASFGWEIGIVDGLILISSTMYINKRLMQHFRRNLKTKANLNQIPHSLKDLWQQTRLIYAAYWIFANIAFYFLFLS